MRYDLEAAYQRCSELGLRATRRSSERLEVVVAPGIILCIDNAANDKDCLIGFEDTPWHHHEDLMFCDTHGYFVEMSYLEMLSCLADGQLLICESRKDGAVTDRWLIHRDYNDEFKYMELGEEFRVFRANVG